MFEGRLDNNCDNKSALLDLPENGVRIIPRMNSND